MDNKTDDMADDVNSVKSWVEANWRLFDSSILLHRIDLFSVFTDESFAYEYLEDAREWMARDIAVEEFESQLLAFANELCASITAEELARYSVEDWEAIADDIDTEYAFIVGHLLAVAQREGSDSLKEKSYQIANAWGISAEDL